MYIEDWDSFYQQAEALFVADPLKTRLVLKYTHSKSKLTVKVTDDRTAVQFRTDQLSDLRKLEQLNSRLFTLASRGPEDADTEMAEAEPNREASPPPQAGAQRKKKPRRTKG